MNKMKWVLLAIPALLLIGCASPAKMENMSINSSKRLTYDKALKNSVALKSASGGQKTNPMWTSEISTEAFAGAVKSTLKSQGLYSDNGRYKLKINMKKTDQPMFGLDLKVVTHVNYTLTDSSTKKVLLNKTISASYTAGMGDSVMAVKRLRLANEGAAKENIKGLLKKLATLKISASSVSVVK